MEAISPEKWNILQIEVCVSPNFVRRNHRWPVDSPYRRPDARKSFPFYGTIINQEAVRFLPGCKKRNHTIGKQYTWRLLSLGQRSRQRLFISRTKNIGTGWLWVTFKMYNLGLLLTISPGQDMCSALLCHDAESFPHYWPFERGIRHHWWILLTKGQVGNGKLWCFLCCKPGQAFKQTFNLPVIWNTTTLTWRYCNVMRSVLHVVEFETSQISHVWCGNEWQITSYSKKRVKQVT